MERLRQWRDWGLVAIALGSVMTRIGVVTVAAAMLMGELARFVPIFDLARHFQTHYLVSTSLAFMVLVLLRINRMAWLTAFVIIVAGARVVPWYLGRAPSTVEEREEAFRIFHANVRYDNSNTDAFIEQIRLVDPDIIVLQEVTSRWATALDELRGRLSDDLPSWSHNITVIRTDAFGLVMLSKHPLDASHAVYHDSDLPSLDCIVRTTSGPLRIVSTHPIPPMTRRATARRDRQLDAVGDALDGVKTRTILVGDLNATMWSQAYMELRDETGMRNARRGFGIFPTWPASLPVLARIPIDHVMVTPDIDVIGFRLGRACGSDHLPVIADLRLPD